VAFVDPLLIYWAVIACVMVLKLSKSDCYTLKRCLSAFGSDV